MKTLIAYYSGTGKTKMAAERLPEVCGGDLIEIKAKKKYGAYRGIACQNLRIYR